MDNQQVKRPELLAISFVQDAKEFVKAARILDNEARKRPGSIPTHSAPAYFLLCQATELVLKAHLAASGVSKKKLRKRIGHNLELAFRYARRCFSFAPAHPHFPQLVRWLSPHHLGHSFRYRKIGLVSLPLVSEAVRNISKTVAGVAPYVRQREMQSRSQTPQS